MKLINLNKSMCPECFCEYSITDYDRAEIICKKCGLILDDCLIDYGTKFNYSNNSDNKKINYEKQSYYLSNNLSYSTIIGLENKDSNGNLLSNRKRHEFYKLRKLDQKTKNSSMKTKRLNEALQNLDRVMSNLELSKTVRETAKYIYCKTEKLGLLKGRSIDGISAAIIYTSCKICMVPRSLHEISTIYKLKENEVGKYYKLINRSFKFNINPPSPQKFVGRFCNELNLDNEVKIKSTDILNHAEKKGLTKGRNPISTAAAAIYLASLNCGCCKTQKEIANVAGITDLGLRNVYKKLIN